MNVRNEGKKAFEFQMLLHSYFRVKVSGPEMYSAAQTPFIHNGTRYRATSGEILEIGDKDLVGQVLHLFAEERDLVMECATPTEHSLIHCASGYFHNLSYRPDGYYIH